MITVDLRVVVVLAIHLEHRVGIHLVLAVGRVVEHVLSRLLLVNVCGLPSTEWYVFKGLLFVLMRTVLALNWM